MHASARTMMARCIERYLDTDRRQRVLDFGSRINVGQTQSHRDLLKGYDVSYLGVDVTDGPNVDVVMQAPYRLPLSGSSVDLVISGQVFEHVPYFWVSIMEIARVLRPGGHVIITVPSRGHAHSSYDCWRYYPDGMRAMAAWSGMEIVEASTDFPPGIPGSRGRHDYAAIDPAGRYWGDTVGVLRKPTGSYPRLQTAVVRQVVRWWANNLKDLQRAPKPKAPAPARKR